MRPLKTVIIGLGNIGMQSDLHLPAEEYTYTHARAFQQHPAFELIAGIDDNKKNCLLYQQHFPGKAYQTIDEQIAQLQPDVIAISVPSAAHYSTLSKLLKIWKPKIILCEKPLSHDLLEAKKIVRICNKNKIPLYLNYVRRADIATGKIKELIHQQVIPLPIKGIVWYSKGLIHNGSHFLDLLRYWLGPVKSFKKISEGELIEGDSQPDVLITFSGGQCYFIAAKEEDYSHYTIELISSEGRIRYDHGGEHVVWQPKISSEHFQGYQYLSKKYETIETNMNNIQWYVAEQLYLAAQDHENSLCTGEEALQGLKTLVSIGNQR